MNLTDLYRNPERARSAELCFGAGWADRRAVPDPIPTRAVYLIETGELYAHGRDGAVRLLAEFPLEQCRCNQGCLACLETGWSCRQVCETLDGWERQEQSAFGYAWLLRRTRAFRPAAEAEGAA